MTASGSPCGACKFLRRKCLKGSCVFAPYFCHEQGASHFAAIHRVFGASNASKLLTHLPIQDRCEAALTIYYEAQARLQDPIYGCVSHIFSLQQQVVNLQRQLEIKKQAIESMMATGYSTIENPNYYRDTYYQHLQEPQDLHPTISNYQNGSLKIENNSDLKNNMTSCYHQMVTDTTSFFGAGGDTTAESYYNNSFRGFSEKLKSVWILDEIFSKNSEVDEHHDLNPFNQFHHGCNDVLSASFI